MRDAPKSTLRWLFYLKFTFVIFMNVGNLCTLFLWVPDGDPFIWLNSIVFVNAMNIMGVATYGYFLGLWHMARGYEIVNQHLNEIFQRSPLDEWKLNCIWSLYIGLNRTTQRICGLYGLQMLAARFDFFIFCVINSYWSYLINTSGTVNFTMLIVGGSLYWVRLFDFYLFDYLCDLVVQYQSEPKHIVSETQWTNELSAFVIYANSSKLTIRICGLFQADRRQWYSLMCAIMSYAIVLVQFHLYLNRKIY
ncbi:putative gustatory receptor 59b [Drosophila tropicalis]|uniref:putative gustatory receptor 59b n=1 Tax=Drosophila tropicalis TaxID=46794 RepID=UPI0035AC193D